MTFTYNGKEVQQSDVSKDVVPVAVSASSWAWGAVVSRVMTGCGLAACGFFYTFAESVSRTICGMVAFAFQAFLIEWGREWIVRRREQRKQAVGSWAPPTRRHPVLRWLAIFVAIEVFSFMVAVVVWRALVK